MSLPHPCNVSGGPVGIETSPRRRQTPNQPPNLLTTSLGNARNGGLGLGAVVQTPVSSTTLSSPFSAYPQSPHPQPSRETMRGASPMASRSASGFGGHYNPQQWGAVNSVSPNSMSMAGEHRQISHSSRTAHLAPRPVGPDEPVASPPPPYSPRRDQQSQGSPRCTSDVISPADTASPDTDFSRYGTPVSAATTLSPDLVARFPGGRSPLIHQHTSPKESPNAASVPSFPPPPGQRTRAGSKNHADRLLSSLTLRAKASKVSLAGDTMQDSTTQLLAQASSAKYDGSTIYPPAARRAASTGGIGLAGGVSRSTSHSPSPVTWEPEMPLPGPPPGPPPRSQSLNRPMESPSSGLAPTLPLRSRHPPRTGTSLLDTVPPTPADWEEEDGIHDRGPSGDRSHGPSPLHIDTGSILRKRRSEADYPLTATAGGSAHPRRDSSAGGLFRSPAVRNRSAMGIRERRSESRNGKGRAVGDSAAEASSSVAPWVDGFEEDVKPTNLVLPASQLNASKQMTTVKSTPKSGKSMRSLDGALNSPEIQKSSGKAVSFESSYTTTPQPGSSRSQHFSANLTSTPPFSPGRETLERSTSAVALPSLPLKALPIPPPKRLSNPSKALSLIVQAGSEQRPVSHLLNLPISDDSMQVPLTPTTKAAQEPLEDLLGPESPKLFAGRAIERHRIFAEREAAAATNSERLDLFIQFMKAESRIRRQQYASVFEEDGIEVEELTQGFFGHSSTDTPFHDRQQIISRQNDSKRTSIASSALGDSSSSQDDSSAVSRKQESPSSSTSSTQQRPESTYWKDYVPCLSPIMSIVTGQDEVDSRGRPPSRWWSQSNSGDGQSGDAFNFKVLEKTKRETRYMGYMGATREARNPSALCGNTIASASIGGGEWEPPGASRQQYPPEKTGLHEDSSLPPPPLLPPTPSSAPFTPDPRKLDISRLVTLPPPFPRHHPAVENNHPELADVRNLIRSLHEKEEAEIMTDSYRTQIREKRQRADSWCKHQRSLHAQDIEFRIQHEDLSQEDFDAFEVELNEKIAKSEKEIIQHDFDIYLKIILSPIHALFSDRIKRADASFEKLSSRLFLDASPNLPQEQGDELPETLEGEHFTFSRRLPLTENFLPPALTQLKWLYEARETLYRQIYDLLSERNDRYKSIVLLPYKQCQNREKHAEAELFFAKDAQERRFKFQEADCKRAQEFLSIIEHHVSRGVELALSAFWDIAPGLLEVLHKVPLQLDGFEVQIPADEYAENPSYGRFPLQYLYTLLGHAEKSTRQFIESQINLFCLLHEIRSHALAARCTVEAQGRDASWAAEERRREETKLTEDLKEKVGIVEGQWAEALGSEMLEVRERVREALLEEGGWDDDADEV